MAKWKWEAQIIERAEPLLIGGRHIRVPLRSDLILLKLAAGGYADLQDAAALLALDETDATMRAVEAHIGEVRPDVHSRWRMLVSDRPT